MGSPLHAASSRKNDGGPGRIGSSCRSSQIAKIRRSCLSSGNGEHYFGSLEDLEHCTHGHNSRTNTVSLLINKKSGNRNTLEKVCLSTIFKIVLKNNQRCRLGVITIIPLSENLFCFFLYKNY